MTLERTTVHVADDTGRIAMLEVRTVGTDPSPATLTRYIYSNHLGTASLELDDTAAIISYEEYHPYGTTSYQAKNASINATAKRYRYTGKERDEESGLYYHGARYYMPWLCRWCAVDPLEGENTPSSGYNYCDNNPIILVDPTGEDPEGGGTSGGEGEGGGTSGGDGGGEGGGTSGGNGGDSMFDENGTPTIENNSVREMFYDENGNLTQDIYRERGADEQGVNANGESWAVTLIIHLPYSSGNGSNNGFSYDGKPISGSSSAAPAQTYGVTPTYSDIPPEPQPEQRSFLGGFLNLFVIGGLMLDGLKVRDLLLLYLIMILWLIHSEMHLV